MRAKGDGVFCAGVTQYAVCEDVHKICDVLRLIRSEIAEDLADQFVLELQVMESPKELAQRLVDTVFFQDVWVAVCLGLMQPVRGVSSSLSFQSVCEKCLRGDPTSVNQLQENVKKGLWKMS